MQVGNLAVDMLGADTLSPVIGGQACKRNHCDDSRCGDPNAGEAHVASLGFRLNRLLYSFAKLRAWRKAFSRHLNRAFHLQTRKGVRRARRALPDMRVESPQFIRRKLSVDVGVEFYF